jgi:AraC-like DNA-binding protein
MSILSHRTDDPDALGESFSRVVGPVSARATRRRGFEAELRAGRLPRAGLFTLRIAAGRLLMAEERPFVAVTVPVSGPFEVHDGCGVMTFREGTAHVFPPAPVLDARCVGGSTSRVLALAMDTSLLESHLQALNGNDTDELRLPSQMSTSVGPGADLLRYLRFLWRELQREESLLAAPRVAREVEETLGAMLAETCGMASAEPMGREDSGDGAVQRRAEEFLDAHLEQPMSLAEVSAAAGASTKTLARSFRKRHDVGPMGFLRRRRLEAARRDLASAGPGSATVTDVALRYGFEHLGRFAGAYREAFGELPSETLGRLHGSGATHTLR